MKLSFLRSNSLLAKSINVKSYFFALIYSFLIFTANVNYINAQTPCDCVDPTPVGTTGQPTDISSLGFGLSGICSNIKGQLVIDQNTTWTYAYMVMDPASEILVENGNTLTVYLSYLESCDTLWRGIRVEGGAKLNFIVNTIEGAEYAIYTHCFSHLNCQYNSFQRNYIGIASGSPYEEPLAECFVHLDRPLVGNSFKCYGILPIPYTGHYYAPDWPTTNGIPYNRSYCAVYLSGTTGLNVGTELDNAIYKNEVDSLRNGFVFEGSFSNVLNNSISNLVGPLHYPYTRFEDYNNLGVVSWESFTEVRENAMEDLCIGVYAKGRGNHIIADNDITLQFPPTSELFTTFGVLAENTQTLRVDTNRIHDALYGIAIARVFDHFTADSNTITTDGIFSPTGIYCPFDFIDQNNMASISQNDIEFDNYGAGTGIRMDYCSGLMVDDNLLTFEHSGSPSIYFGFGIWISQGGMNSISHNFLDNNAGSIHHGLLVQSSSENTYFCNDIDDFAVGIFAMGASAGSRFISNYIGSGRIGFQLFSQTTISDQLWFGNNWDGTYANWAAFISGSDVGLTAQGSMFFVDENDGQYHYPEGEIGPLSISGDGDWFDNAPEDTKDCELSGGENVYYEADSLYKRLIDTIQYSDFDVEMQWMLKAHTFRAMLIDASLGNHTGLDSFFSAEEDSVLGKLVSYTFDLNHDVYTYPDSTLALGEEILDSLAGLKYYDKELADPPNDSVALEAAREDLVEFLDSLHGIWDSIRAIDMPKDTALLEALDDSLDVLSTTLDLEEFYRRILRYSIKFRLKGPDSLTSADISEIREISTLCTWEGGPAPVLAQILYRTLHDTTYTDLTTCQDIEPRSVTYSPEAIIDGVDLRIYPNPNTGGGELTIEWKGNEKPDKISIFDINGRLVMQQSIFASDEHRIQFTLPDLHSGMYFLKVYQGDAKLAVAKLLILSE